MEDFVVVRMRERKGKPLKVTRVKCSSLFLYCNSRGMIMKGMRRERGKEDIFKVSLSFFFF